MFLWSLTKDNFLRTSLNWWLTSILVFIIMHGMALKIFFLFLLKAPTMLNVFSSCLRNHFTFCTFLNKPVNLSPIKYRFTESSTFFIYDKKKKKKKKKRAFFLMSQNYIKKTRCWLWLIRTNSRYLYVSKLVRKKKKYWLKNLCKSKDVYLYYYNFNWYLLLL